MMPRILEPELMENIEQVVAYAKADFSHPNSDFIRRVKLCLKNPDFQGRILDLGCGPGDISRRLAKAFPESKIDAIDGSLLMLDIARSMTAAKVLPRVNYIHGTLPNTALPDSPYDLIVSNSLLHHLHDPQGLWRTVKKYAHVGTKVVVMDLLRPVSTYFAETLMEMYTATEPKVLQKDFYNSLLAAFTIDEIKEQLIKADLNFKVEKISDRHVFISGSVE